LSASSRLSTSFSMNLSTGADKLNWVDTDQRRKVLPRSPAFRLPQPDFGSVTTLHSR
jgi:hypothetical protein